jgi:hypothetical protein
MIQHVLGNKVPAITDFADFEERGTLARALRV